MPEPSDPGAPRPALLETPTGLRFLESLSYQVAMVLALVLSLTQGSHTLLSVGAHVRTPEWGGQWSFKKPPSSFAPSLRETTALHRWLI